MLPTVLAGERGWFSCDRCRTRAETSKRASKMLIHDGRDVGGGGGAEKAVYKRKTKQSSHEQKHAKIIKNKRDSEH